jgi:2-polyprenyl-6-hydroxyphenyl methylase/3-demethylubiquinone-9 3-methyltransferase
MKKPMVNNEYYHDLGEQWYEADNDPVAILRVEQQIKNPWIHGRIQDCFNRTDLSIADIGCGAGFLTNELGQTYSDVHGLDASQSSLDVAQSRDLTGTVRYQLGDAYRLPYEDQSMDVVCAMDFLEHVDDPDKVVSECARVLKPGGLFFYHTFNRNLLAWLIVIKFMEWFVPNTPKHLHVLHLFIKPAELIRMMKKHDLINREVRGIGPQFNYALIRSISARRVLPGFRFHLTAHTLLGYIGFARKTVMGDATEEMQTRNP